MKAWIFKGTHVFCRFVPLGAYGHDAIQTLSTTYLVQWKFYTLLLVMFHLCSPCPGSHSSVLCFCLIETPATSEVMQLSVPLWLICFMSLFAISFLSLFWNTKNLPHPLFSGNSHHCRRAVVSSHLSLKDNYNLFYENQNDHHVWRPAILWAAPRLSWFYPTQKMSVRSISRGTHKGSQTLEENPIHVVVIVIVWQGLWSRVRLLSSTSPHCLGW